jgi:L-threonylcarbamoyladenylate synthase
MITSDQAATFERCMAVGGVALFGTDTVYGLACEPESREALERLYAMKGRRPDKPSAVMFFALDLALAALPELGPRTVAALEGLLPGGVTLLLPNPVGRFPLASGFGPGGPSGPGPGGAGETLGLRVPALSPTAASLSAVRWPVLQTSANLAGAPEARTLDDVAGSIRGAADLVLDAGPLPGIASTVVDLRAWEDEGRWEIVRAGAVSRGCVASGLGVG